MRFLYRLKVNERVLGSALIALGLVGLMLGFRAMEKPAQSALACLRPAPKQGVALASLNHSGQRQPCRVLNVYDGDTIGCDLDGDGKIERPQEEIRLLGIDTPERSYSRKNPTYGSANPTDEPYAKASSEWMAHQIAGKMAYLQYDLRKTDRYGRTLAFVYVSAEAKQSLNEQTLVQGYATLLFLGKNRLYEERFTQAEQQARQAKRGLWGLGASVGF